MLTFEATQAARASLISAQIAVAADSVILIIFQKFDPTNITPILLANLRIFWSRMTLLLSDHVGIKCCTKL